MRRILEQSTTPDGESLELVFERGHYVLRVGGKVLMSSECHGSERAMIHVALERWRAGSGTLRRRATAEPRVLIGGLGMGHTLRETLDQLGPTAHVDVVELLPAVLEYHTGILGPLAGHPTADPRVQMILGDIGATLDIGVSAAGGGWDIILLDVDNGPEALVDPRNARLYDADGSQRLHAALRPGGVAVIWSVAPSITYERTLRRAGCSVTARRIRARWPISKGASHTLFVAERN